MPLLQYLRKGKKVWVLVLLVVLLALLARVVTLGKNSFVADEFIDVNASYGYAQTGSWHAWDWNEGQPTSVDFFAPRDERTMLYRLQVATLFRFFPPTEAAARSVSVLWGIIGVLVVFWSTRVFTNRTSVALLAALLVAVSPTAIEFDRKVRMYAMFAPFYLLLTTLLFLFLEKPIRSARFAMLTTIARWSGMNPYYLLPVCAVALVTLHLQLLTVNLLFAVVGYCAAKWLLSRVYPTLFPAEKNTRVVLFAALISGLLFGLLAFVKPVLFHNILALFSFFINNSGYLAKAFSNFEHPLLGLILALLGAAFLSLRWQRPKEALYLALGILIPLVLTAFVWSRTQGLQYIAYLLPLISMLTATGVVGLAEWFAKHAPRLHPQTIFVVVVFLAVLLLPRYSYFLDDDTTYQRDRNRVADYRKVFTYLKKERAADGALITRHFRNYYFRDWQAPLLDFGGERSDHDLTLAEITQFTCAHPEGFLVIFDNDANFITKEAVRFIEDTYKKIDHSAVRGAVDAYRWERSTACP